MVEVNLWSGLRRFADDSLVVPVEANTVREMLDALVKVHPALAPVIKAGVSVMIDGVLAPDLTARVGPANEVFLVQRIKGG